MGNESPEKVIAIQACCAMLVVQDECFATHKTGHRGTTPDWLLSILNMNEPGRVHNFSF